MENREITTLNLLVNQQSTGLQYQPSYHAVYPKLTYTPQKTSMDLNDDLQQTYLRHIIYVVYLNFNYINKTIQNTITQNNPPPLVHLYNIFRSKNKKNTFQTFGSTQASWLRNSLRHPKLHQICSATQRSLHHPHTLDLEVPATHTSYFLNLNIWYVL